MIREFKYLSLIYTCIFTHFIDKEQNSKTKKKYNCNDLIASHQLIHDITQYISSNIQFPDCILFESEME